MKIVVNKEYFKNLPEGVHELKANFKDGFAEGVFEVKNKIMFYLHMEEQYPFTATKGQTWSEWMQSFPDWNTSGNGILYVDADLNLYIDPLNPNMPMYYQQYETGDSGLILVDDNWEPQTLSSVITPNGIYGSRMCCFDAGTKILMADFSLKNIEEIVIGDEIISYNEDSQKFEPDKVTNCIIKHNSDDLVYITLSDDTQLGMRAYHPLLTAEGWKSLRPHLAEAIADIHKEVDLLQVGDILKGIDTDKTIKEIIIRPTIENYNTYNLTVAKNHNYIANGIVAHNATCK